MRLLFGGVDDRDVGHAVALALTHEPVDHFAAFNIMADSGLTDDDVFALDADVTTALEQRWPGVTDLARERGVDLRESIWGRLLFPVNKAKSDLGYRPRYDFSAFVEAVASRRLGSLSVRRRAMVGRQTTDGVTAIGAMTKACAIRGHDAADSSH